MDPQRGNDFLKAMMTNLRRGVWYVRRVKKEMGRTDANYWIVTNPVEFYEALQRGEPPNMKLTRTFPRDRWRAALDWAIQQSRGRVAPPAPRPAAPTVASFEGVALPQGPSRAFVAGAELDVVYPESSGGEIRER